MDEMHWLTSFWPGSMLTALRGGASIRKLRLFAVACCRRVWHLILDSTVRRAVEVAERFADGGATEEEREAAALVAGAAPVFHEFAPAPPRPPQHLVPSERHAAWAAVYAYATGYSSEEADAHAASAAGQAALAVQAAHAGAWLHRGLPAPLLPDLTESLAQAQLLRDVFGNPFRPVTIEASWLAWRDGIVGQLAASIYEERRFADVPILADALEDAGCTEAPLLAHCRGHKEHVRGCWVVDRLLGKE